jgi:predicted MFS family arabinose efflux permease
MDTSSGAERFSRGYRAWLLGLLVFIYMLNLADRLGFAVMGQSIKLDLGISDSRLGLLQGLPFAIFYSLMGFPIARLAERVSRTKIIAICVALFGVMVALCSRAHSFGGLLLLRMGVGVGDGGFQAPVASLIGDHYPMNRRASVMSIIWLGAPLGVLLGSTAGGWIAEHYSWRLAFAAIGVLSLGVAVVSLLSLRDPPRGMSDPGTVVRGPPPSAWTALRFLLAKRSMWHILAGCALAATSMNGIGQFMSPFLQRNFHIGPAESGLFVALTAVVPMGLGLLIGGFGMDWAARVDKRWYVWGPALGLALAAPLFVLGFSQATVTATVLVLIVAHVSMFLYYSPSLALAQNMVGANMRASSAFVVSLVLGLVGIGLGPTIVGMLSDHFAASAFRLGTFAALCPGGKAAAGAAGPLLTGCAQASALGVRQAMMVIALLGLWAALHYLLAARNLRRDLETQYQEPQPALEAASPAR